MNDTNENNPTSETKFYVLTREISSNQPGYSLTKQYWSIDLMNWTMFISEATLYGEEQKDQWHRLFATSNIQKMEEYIDPCTDGHSFRPDITDYQHTWNEALRCTETKLWIEMTCVKCGIDAHVEASASLPEAELEALHRMRIAR